MISEVQGYGGKMRRQQLVLSPVAKMLQDDMRKGWSVDEEAHLQNKVHVTSPQVRREPVQGKRSSPARSQYV
jgi:hypothetical protein